MADQDTWRKNIPEGYDGRFGERFDDEVNPKGVVYVAVGILMICVVALLICWPMYKYMERSAEESLNKTPSPIDAANERYLPSGPRLQASPEEELEHLREEMSTRLNSYGWTDEGRALVHIPIADAIALVAAGAVPVAVPIAVGEEEPALDEVEGGVVEASSE